MIDHIDYIVMVVYFTLNQRTPLPAASTKPLNSLSNAGKCTNVIFSNCRRRHRRILIKMSYDRLM